MCQYNSQLNLVENGKGYISWCQNCKLYSLTYLTCCIAFTRGEFKNFNKVLNELTDDHFTGSHLEEDTVFLRSTKGCMGICLTRGQVEELKEMFARAINMHEIYTLIQ